MNKDLKYVRKLAGVFISEFLKNRPFFEDIYYDKIDKKIIVLGKNEDFEINDNFINLGLIRFEVFENVDAEISIEIELGDSKGGFLNLIGLLSELKEHTVPYEPVVSKDYIELHVDCDKHSVKKLVKRIIKNFKREIRNGKLQRN